jgi:DNA repair exonuclease SbcCD ATPase subunit
MEVTISDLTEELKKIIDDINNAISDLQQILDLVYSEKEITSYDSSYCKDCKEPCGRSNAEVYNCMMKKIQKTNQIQQKYNNIEYSKEYLQSDLKKIIEDLKQRKIELLELFKKLKI